MADQPNKRLRLGNSAMNSYQPSLVRSQYEIHVEVNPYDYDVWHEYLDFEKREGSHPRVRQTFEKAIQHVPRERKRFWWPDYIDLWLKYASFEELEAGDVERARAVYSRCIQLIPHEKFSFDKVWISAAEFEIKESNFENARTLYESAIEKAPTSNIFKAYIEMMRELGDLKECKTMYMRYVQWSPDDDHSSWLEFIEFEKSQSNPNGTRFLYDVALSQPALKKSVPLWNSYIDFELSQDDPEKVRDLYEKLLECTKHSSVWIKYARFQASLAEELLHMEEVEDEISKRKRKKVLFAETYIQRVRDIFRKALRHFTASTRPNSEERTRVRLLLEWESLERRFGSLGKVNLVLDLFSRFQHKSEGIVLS